MRERNRKYLHNMKWLFVLIFVSALGLFLQLHPHSKNDDTTEGTELLNSPFQLVEQGTLTPKNQGWHNILVFYGNEDLLPVPPSSKWFSQAHQDEIVAALFRNQTNLYFLDLAANDAVYLSNTLGLERNLNWTGMNFPSFAGQRRNRMFDRWQDDMHYSYLAIVCCCSITTLRVMYRSK